MRAGATRQATVRGPHVVATALKRYFRDLPTPIVPVDCYNMFLSAADIPVHENQLRHTG